MSFGTRLISLYLHVRIVKSNVQVIICFLVVKLIFPTYAGKTFIISNVIKYRSFPDIRIPISLPVEDVDVVILRADVQISAKRYANSTKHCPSRGGK